MLTAIRSAVACDEVARSDTGQINYLGIYGDTLRADSKPGFVSFWIALLVDVDGRRTLGSITLEAADYRQSFPFETPAGLTMTSLSFPVLIPVQRDDTLRLTVSSGPGQGKPLRIKWNLGFEPNAKAADLDDWKVSLQKVQAEADVMSANFAAQAKPRH